MPVSHSRNWKAWIPWSRSVVHRLSESIASQNCISLQVDALNNELVLEKRIKEGAENLLDMDLTVRRRKSVFSALP